MRPRLAGFFLLLLMLAAAVAVGWHLLSGGSGERGPLPWEGEEADRYVIDAPVFSEMRGDRLLRTFSARRFEIVRRSFLAFQTRAVRQALFHDARLVIRRTRETTIGEPPPPLIGDLDGMVRLVAPAAPAAAGVSRVAPPVRITRAVLAPFTLEVLVDETPFLRLIAQSAVVEKDPGRITFTAATLENLAEHKRIVSQTIHWDEKRQSFEIPGVYFAESPRGRAMARSLRVGLDFALSPL